MLWGPDCSYGVWHCAASEHVAKGGRVGCAHGYAGYELSYENRTRLLTSNIYLIDTSYIALSRFILLDPLLMFFLALSLFFLVHFRNLRNRYYIIHHKIQIERLCK